MTLKTLSKITRALLYALMVLVAALMAALQAEQLIPETSYVFFIFSLQSPHSPGVSVTRIRWF